MLFRSRVFTSELGRTQGDVMFMPSPLNHATGFFHGLISPLLLGGRAVLQQDFRPREAIELMNAEGVTWSMSATPFIYDMLNVLDAEDGLAFDTLRLFCCGGAPLPPALIERAARYGVLLCEIYGSTESCPHVFVPPSKCVEWNGDWSGIPFPGIEVRYIDEQGNNVAPGVQGEHISRGPHQFVGYLNEPERTDRALSLSGVFDECMWIIGNPLASTLAVISGLLAFSFTGVCVVIGALMFLTELTTEPKSQTQLAREAGLTREEYRKREAAKAQRMRERDAADRARREAEARGDDEQAVQAAVDRAIADSRAGKKESIWGPGLIAVCVTWFSLGAFQSASNISIIAFATEANMKQYTGFVFACFSFSSLCGALVYGAKNWTIPLWKRFYFCLIVVNLGVGTFMFAKHLWVIMIIYLLIGVCQAPTWINGNQLMLHLVPPTRFTEGVAWMGAMNSIGSSAGSAIAGVFIDHMGSHGGFLMATVLAITSLAIAFVGFRQIKSSTETPTLTEVSV